MTISVNIDDYVFMAGMIIIIMMFCLNSVTLCNMIVVVTIKCFLVQLRVIRELHQVLLYMIKST